MLKTTRGPQRSRGPRIAVDRGEAAAADVVAGQAKIARGHRSRKLRLKLKLTEMPLNRLMTLTTGTMTDHAERPSTGIFRLGATPSNLWWKRISRIESAMTIAVAHAVVRAGGGNRSPKFFPFLHA